MALVQKIEQIYDFACDKVSIRMNNNECHVLTSEYFWTAFPKNIKPLKQSLSNFLYSVVRLSENKKNMDIIFFDMFLRSEKGMERPQFLLFLLLRLLFQKIMDKDIINRNSLQIDPICTDLTLEVVKEILSHLHDSVDYESDDDVWNECCEQAKETGLVEYYAFMLNVIGKLSSSQSEKEYLAAIKTLSEVQITEKSSPSQIHLRGDHELESEWGVERETSFSRSPEKILTGGISSIDTRKNSFLPNDNNNNNNNNSGNNGIQDTSPQRKQPQTQIIDSQRVEECKKEMAIVYSEMEGDSALNQKIRVAMVKLVTRFIEVLISENTAGSQDPENLMIKMSQIVVRKSQNLLTCLFRSNKKGFMDLLMIKDDFGSDSIRVDQVFQKYGMMAKENESFDSEVDQLVKGVLKVAGIY